MPHTGETAAVIEWTVDRLLIRVAQVK